MSHNGKNLEKELTFTRFDQMSERYPENTAVFYLGQGFSFSRIRGLSERFAGALQNLGVKKNDRVMIYIPNCVQWVIAFLAIQKMGAVLVPVSPIYTSHELDYMIKDSGAETIICQDTNFCYASDVFAESGYQVVIDMRGPNEDRGIDDFGGAVESRGMKYVTFPIASPDEINLEKAAELDRLLEGIDGPVPRGLV